MSEQNEAFHDAEAELPPSASGACPDSGEAAPGSGEAAPLEAAPPAAEETVTPAEPEAAPGACPHCAYSGRTRGEAPYAPEAL